MSGFITPHYTREFELRQKRIRELRKQQESQKMTDTVESRRQSGGFSTLAMGDQTKTLATSRRSFGVAPPPRARSAGRHRIENFERSESRERDARARARSGEFVRISSPYNH